MEGAEQWREQSVRYYSSALGKIQQVMTNFGGGGEGEGEQGWGPHPEQSVGDFFLKQLHYLLHLLCSFWAFLVDKFNQVLPPPEIIDETLHKWAHVGLTSHVLPIGLALLVFYWCCCRRSDGAGRNRMMRAPGRGALMPRASFKADPKGYFLNLRANKHE